MRERAVIEWHGLRGSLVDLGLRDKGEVMAVDNGAPETIERFHEVLNRRDLGALAELITDDCVFEATSPGP